MTKPAQPHVHCDTCSDIECQFHAANITNWKTSEQLRLRRVALEVLRSVGCASHSDTRRQQPQQPDALAEILNNPRVLVKKESPCYSNPSNTSGTCIFENERCDECVDKHSTAMRIVIPNDIFATIRSNQQPDALGEYCAGLIRYIKEAQLDTWEESEIISAINCTMKAEIATIRKEREQK